MAGLTEEGFSLKRFEEILTDLRSTATDLFSDVTPAGDIVDTSDNTALGRMIALITPSLTDLWQASQQVYDAFNPATADGIALDNLVAFSGISRFQSAATTAACLFEGTNGQFAGLQFKVRSINTLKDYSLISPVYFNLTAASGIAINTTVVANSTTYFVRYTNDGGVTYTTFSIVSDASATSAEILAALKTNIDTNASAVVKTYYKNNDLFIERLDPFQTVTFEISSNLTCTKAIKLATVVGDEIGPIEEFASTITDITVPQTGLDSVYNPLPASTGRFEETDEELRERFRNVKFTQAENIIEAIISEIRSVEGVDNVVIYENDTDTTDSKGIPPHAFMPIVLNGLSSEIANAIWQNKPTGIKSFGTTSVQVVDSQGIEHTVSFKRPTPRRVYISMTLDVNGAFPGDGTALIRQELINYFADNYSIGDSVIYSRLFTPINNVGGHQINSMTIGFTASPVGTTNLTLTYDEIASLASADIVITTI
jgi:uncharacterized phage protein gp47/JayE